MAPSRHGRSAVLIETDAIIVAYAMSRLDRRFLEQFGFRSWKAAFASTGEALGVPATSMKNLRDEFDPVHMNARAGWHKRPLRANRQRVLGEFCDASDEAVIEIVNRLLSGDAEAEALVSKPLAVAKDRASNVAERLRTGRVAEEYFISNSLAICGIPPHDLVDLRAEARGFDFAISNKSAVVEVKGIKAARGDILFTDHEWSQAHRRLDDYWLVVVGALAAEPRAKLLKNPAHCVRAASTLRQATVVSWRASISV